ncbi:MAG: exodeoxyribonuclease VII large subunit [Bacteroidetes bacterium]|nr:MAG: exodeoxyribonuclease VII large subunit [Bacteroidota bacterium]
MKDVKQVYTVGELTQYLKYLLEQDTRLRGVSVSGEISNITYHSSGHVYFSAKDAGAQLSCVMFRSYAQRAPRLQNGDKVVLTGNMTIYPPRGNYQLMVQLVQKELGKGDLYQQFLELKEKLQKEGLFDAAHKKPIPLLPRRIGVLTSPTGAAIRDIIRTLRRRYNMGEVIIIPTVVQGEQGVASIVRSLKQAEGSGADVLILARGGGSIEDLWNFNEEAVARAIYACSIPLITGVGHESDFTIADFVADVRASTPTAAAERAVPEKAAIYQMLEEYRQQLKRGLQYFIDFKRQVLDDYANRLEQAALKQLRDKRHELALLQTRLKGMDTTRLLDQGYTLTLKAGKILKSSQELKEGETIETVFADGRVRSEVKQVEKK